MRFFAYEADTAHLETGWSRPLLKLDLFCFFLVSEVRQRMLLVAKLSTVEGNFLFHFKWVAGFISVIPRNGVSLRSR